MSICIYPSPNWRHNGASVNIHQILSLPWEAFTSHLDLALCSLHTENLFLISLKRKLKPWGRVSKRQWPGCYSRRFSYMLLDWAQILKGSGFFCPELSVWSGAGASAGEYSGSTCVPWLGDAVCRLRWLETLCWELFWLSFLSSGCWKWVRGARREDYYWFSEWVFSISLSLFSTSVHTYINISTTFWLPPSFS